MQFILGCILVLSALGVILARKPVHSGLYFLVVLLTLSEFYLQLSAEFIAVMQVIVYAGAILVIFMFVIVLFQDAHQKLENYKPNSLTWFLFISAAAFILSLGFFGKSLLGLPPVKEVLKDNYGSVQALGMDLYLDFFFPFEIVIFLFLIAVVGAVYVGKKTGAPVGIDKSVDLI